MSEAAGKPQPIRVERIAEHPSFRRLDSIAGITIDLRYTTPLNFAGRVLYEAGMPCAWLRVEAAAGLERAVAALAAHHSAHPSALQLVVLDALRPHRVQQAIWREVAGTPMQLYFADPARGSIHSYGMAVDVTLRDAQGRELDMGSAFDEASERSHPDLEAAQLAAGVITPAHIASRETLRSAMRAGGFSGIGSEWWHFNFGDPERVRREMARVD